MEAIVATAGNRGRPQRRQRNVRYHTLVVVALGVALATTGCFGFGPVGTPHGANQPTAPAPHVASPGPPSAYVEFGRPGRWMAQGSSCWSSGGVEGCADAVPPEDLPRVPRLVVARGADGRIHLGFDASSAELTLGGRPLPVHGSRTLTFTARRAGLLLAFVNHGSDDATYVARIAFAGRAG